MTDWIDHDGGPQPVGDDVWVEAQWPFAGAHFSGEPDEMEQASELPWEGCNLRYRVVNQHLIDAARLEGIRLGLEAAAKAADDGAHWASESLREAHDNYLRSEGRSDGLTEATDLIRNLNPETIAKEAKTT